jgi:hypothetical protein
VYRLNNNDPINLPRNDVHETLTDWLAYFDFDLARLSAPILNPNQILALEPPRVQLPCHVQITCSQTNRRQQKILGKCSLKLEHN